MSLNIKNGDNVKIVAGNDKGKTGTVIKTLPDANRVYVKGSNLATDKHFVKPRSAQEKGGIIEKERAIDASNIEVICPACGAATRVAYKIEEVDGKKVKTRICKKCNASLDTPKAAKAAKKATKTASKTAKKTTAKKTATKKAAKED